MSQHHHTIDTVHVEQQLGFFSYFEAALKQAIVKARRSEEATIKRFVDINIVYVGVKGRNI